MTTDLEQSFLTHWKMLAPFDMRDWLVPQHRFHSVRRFKIDFAIPDHKISIELNGAGGGGFGRTVKCHACGTTVRARKKNGALGKPLYVAYPSHSKGSMTTKDAEKNNLLTSMGWRCFVVTPQLLKQSPQIIINQIVEVIESEQN